MQHEDFMRWIIVSKNRYAHDSTGEGTLNLEELETALLDFYGEDAIDTNSISVASKSTNSSIGCSSWSTAEDSTMRSKRTESTRSAKKNASLTRLQHAKTW